MQGMSHRERNKDLLLTVQREKMRLNEQFNLQNRRQLYKKSLELLTYLKLQLLTTIFMHKMIIRLFFVPI